MLPLLAHKECEDDEKIYGESYDSEDNAEISEHASEIMVEQHGSDMGSSQGGHHNPVVMLKEFKNDNFNSKMDQAPNESGILSHEMFAND